MADRTEVTSMPAPLRRSQGTGTGTGTGTGSTHDTSEDPPAYETADDDLSLGDLAEVRTSYDLLAELPQLLAALPRAWGHIAGVTVNGAAWSAGPGRMLVANQVVRLRKAVAAHAPDTVVLLAPGHGRWDLLVVPPDTTKEAAEPIMTAVLGDRA
ncbi:DUF5994 family protein [Streptomyces collinus]|uniref:DUF5994 family protein n=1 Tax=Streptomyces collinus TaxID=42684 RepID=UPI00368ED324